MALVKSTLAFLALALVFGLGCCDSVATRDGDCFITDVADPQWDTKLRIDITDTDRGVIFRRRTNNIYSVTRIRFVGCEVKDPSYVTANITDDEFFLSLVDNKFENYELNETSMTINVAITFDCYAGDRTLLVTLALRDTNNHAPVFLPSNNYDYSVRLPLRAGYPVSSVYGDIVVRDDDLTNFGIFPQMQQNEFFDLVFVQRNFTERFYQLSLITKKEVTVIAEPINLFITAMDLDTTGYPPLITIGSITIRSNGTDETPDSAVFESPYYNGLFDTDDPFVGLDRNMSLARGYEEGVTFMTTGVGAQYFVTVNNGNSATLVPTSTPVPENIVLSPRVYALTVVAKNANNDTIASTAIVLKFVKSPNCKLEDFEDSVWTNGLNLNIADTHRGDSIRAATSNVIRIIRADYETGALNDPPYFTPILYGSRLDFEFYDGKFRNLYELQETPLSFKTNVVLKCRRGERILPVTHRITDTNNNSPQLISGTVYDIFTPIPANFSITRYYGDIVVRDVDLTTYGLEVSIQSNDYVRVEYQGRGSNPKEFIIAMFATRQIQSLNSSVTLDLTIKDLDLTGDAQRMIVEGITLRAYNTVDEEDNILDDNYFY